MLRVRANRSTMGTVPIAFIHLHAGSITSADQLLTYVTPYLARYKLPKAVYLVEQLPRNAAGKLLRRELYHLLPGQG